MSALSRYGNGVTCQHGAGLRVTSFDDGGLMLSATAALGSIHVSVQFTAEQAEELISELQAGIAAARLQEAA